MRTEALTARHAPRPAAQRPVLTVMSHRGRGSIAEPAWARLAELAQVRIRECDRGPDREQAVALLRDTDVLGCTNRCLPPIDAALLSRLPRLRWLVLYATGYDHIDLELLRDHGVGLSVLPEYATTAVAEHALGMTLSLATRSHLAHDRARGLVPDDTSLRGVELHGRVAGVLGVGRIGRRVAHLAAGVGMKVLGCDIDPNAVFLARQLGIEMASQRDLLERSDAVILCASHARGAPPILGRDQIARMGPGSFVVNVARAALTDTEAAVEAVRIGRLRGFAIDDAVIDTTRDGDLLTQGRILQTGHSAWWRDEVLARGARMFAESLIAAAAGRPINVVPLPAPPPTEPAASLPASPSAESLRLQEEPTCA